IVAVLVERVEILLLVQELAILERGEAGLGHHVVLEVEDLLEIAQRHVEQQADAARQRLQEPDMGDRRGELDMAHALAAHLGDRDRDAAFLAGAAAVLHALVLAAHALIVLDRPEDARAEQAVALRLEGAVVDRLRLLDLAERPGVDIVRAGDRDADLIEGRGLSLLLEEVGDLVHRLSLSWRCRASGYHLRLVSALTGGRSPQPRAVAYAAYSAAAGGSCGLSTGSLGASSTGRGASELTSSTL